MLKVGITGGIGSGKSYISRCFEYLGIPVYYADTEAKRLTNEDAEIRRKVSDLLGKQSYTTSGLNREYVASKVFNDKNLLTQLNQIIHPAVEKDFVLWAEKQSAPYVLKEAAILFESGSYKNTDRVIVVDAPLELRIQRVLERDNTSREEILKRIQNQWPADKKKDLADFVIYNDNKTLILPQILRIDKTLQL